MPLGTGCFGGLPGLVQGWVSRGFTGHREMPAWCVFSDFRATRRGRWLSFGKRQWVEFRSV